MKTIEQQLIEKFKQTGMSCREFGRITKLSHAKIWRVLNGKTPWLVRDAILIADELGFEIELKEKRGFSTDVD